MTNVSEQRLMAKELLSEFQITSLENLPFRRLTNDYEKEVPLDLLCQSLHVSNRAGTNARLLMGKGQSSYYLHTNETIMAEIEAVLKIGIEKVFLQIIASDENLSTAEKIDDCRKVIEKVRGTFGNDLVIMTDPQGVCFREDLRWGVSTNEKEIDAERTLDVLIHTASSFADAGINAFITIGRVNHEVKAVREAYNRLYPGVDVYSFSTNSETSNAYIQETKYDPGLALTGQKILVGNKHEMILRALIDVAEGTQMMLQKPIESFHLVEYIRCLIEEEIALESFLSKPVVKRLIEDNNLAGDLFVDTSSLLSNLKKVKLGAYEVSGTYMIYKMLEENPSVSEKLIFSLLDEMYKGFCSAAGNSLGLLVGRNMSWYARLAKEYK
ncbi:hypothetical protein [Dyadobacter beijingensis]|nr:hypothetical protein [Dyadobacter beijingensis]